MNPEEKLRELLIIFIITLFSFYAIKIFFQIVKVTTVEVRSKEEKDIIENRFPFGGYLIN
tara:strand:+ start:423 stop:602 length:180 start_codon:yes stop_codon:yes gene_type:complete